VTLVQDITLSIMSSEFIAITGRPARESRAAVFAGLLDLPTSGDVLIDGVSTTGMTEADRAEVRLTRLGFVFQFHFCCRNLDHRKMSRCRCARWKTVAARHRRAR